MSSTKNPNIERALEAVDRERIRIEDERTAFIRFVDRLSRIEFDRGRREGAIRPNRLLVRETPTGRAMEQIGSAYRDTVMSTPHFDADYGTSFREDVAAEFGPEIAHVLTAADRLEPTHYRTILSAANQSKRERTEFLRVLNAEFESLERIDRRLSDVERQAFELGADPVACRSFGDLIADRERLVELEETCDELATRRQEEIHTRSLPGTDSVGDTSFVGYLYADLDVPCPALADVIAVLGHVREHRRRCEHELGNRR